jgi:hypothetical protein
MNALLCQRQGRCASAFALFVQKAKGPFDKSPSSIPTPVAFSFFLS